MSFWDSIKPSKPAPIPTEVSLSEDKRLLSVRWTDGADTRVSARTLRQLCPCAGCVDEWSNQRTLDTTKIPEGITIDAVQPVGNYALQFNFSDGHSTGIYEWGMLRETSEKVPA
jgi:DUF971 family protein